jgi:hypothetical protein
MEPTPTPTNPESATSPITPTPKPKRRRLGLPTWALVLIAVVVVVGLGIALFMIFKGGPGGNSSSVYYDRPGYDRQSLGTGIGDPAAVSPVAVDSPVTAQQAKIIQACNIITPSDLQQNKFLLGANPLPGNIERMYFDGQGKGQLPVDDFNLPTDGNNCNYRLVNSNGIEISVYQPPVVTASAIGREVNRRFELLSDKDGIKTYTRKSGNDVYYMLWAGQAAVQLFVRSESPADAAKAPKLLDLATKNFANEIKNAAGPWQTAYKTPTFTKPIANACDILKADDVKTVFTTEASPLVQETIATATGVVRYGEDDSQPYNYVNHRCKRTPVRTSLRNAQSVTVETLSYLSDAPAKADMAFHHNSGKVTELPAKVGDEAFFSSGTQNEVVVRKGRVIVRLSFSNLHDNKSIVTEQQQITTLTPLAQTIVGRLTNL